MLLVSLFALALAGADPAPAPAPAEAAHAADPAKPTATPQAFTPTPEEPFPVGAPHDDYGFVGWCYGALAGHMELYKMVKPELDKQSTNKKEDAALDAEQMKAGEEYLALYKKAMEAAEKASPQPINAKGAQAIKSGANIWTPAQDADPKTRMWSYLSWDLPGRCESTSERLYERSLLAAQALGVTIEDDSAKPAAAAKTDTPAPDAKAAAAAKAGPAAETSTAPLRGLE